MMKTLVYKLPESHKYAIQRGLVMRILFSLMMLICIGCASSPQIFRKVAQSEPVYYVDYQNGNDLNDGLSQEKAWKTFRNIKERKFNPGTGFLLRRNQVWHESLYLKSSGTSDRMISIGSYGEGSFPRIDGSFEVRDQQWSQESENIWSASLASDQNEDPAKMFIDANAVESSLLKENSAELTSEGQWAWEPKDGGKVFIYSTKNPKAGGKKAEFNVLRYSIDLKRNHFVSLKEIEVARSRDGIRVGGNNCSISQVIAKENTLNGVQVTGSENRFSQIESFQNGIEFQIGKTGRTGHGILVSGANNEFENIIASDNEEDGVQFGPQAGSGNRFINSTTRRNGENCFDVKSGDQQIIGGDLRSDGDSSEGCIVVHKVPHHVLIGGVSAFAKNKGPTIAVFQGARVTIRNARLRSELSSAVRIDSSAGDRTLILDSVIEGGGLKSKALIEVRGGKLHLIKGNKLVVETGVEPIRVVAPAEAEVSENKISKKP